MKTNKQLFACSTCGKCISTDGWSSFSIRIVGIAAVLTKSMCADSAVLLVGVALLHVLQGGGRAAGSLFS